MSFRRSLNTALLAGLLLAVSSPASAYVHDQLDDGTLLHWCVDEITLHLASVEPEEMSLDEVETVYKKAIDQWANITKCTMPKLTYGGRLDIDAYTLAYDPCNANDSKNVLFFVKDKDTWTNELGLGENILGFTFRIFDRDAKTGNIFDADIVVADWSTKFASSDVVPNDQMDIETVLVHELGHVLGMGHSKHPEATMFAAQPPGETKKRDLHDDDVDGICYTVKNAACSGLTEAPCIPPDTWVKIDGGATADEGKTTGDDGEDEKDSGGGGCSTHPSDSSAPVWPAAALLLGLVAVLRRRSA
jgi:MYXO-CTERM domain-containing protein